MDKVYLNVKIPRIVKDQAKVFAVKSRLTLPEAVAKLISEALALRNGKEK